MSTVVTAELRARFARRLSDLYGQEVPAYTTLVEVSHEVNRGVLERDGAAAERLGSIDRVTAERHGAIRVGTPEELGQVARVFGALEGIAALCFGASAVLVPVGWRLPQMTSSPDPAVIVSGPGPPRRLSMGRSSGGTGPQRRRRAS